MGLGWAEKREWEEKSLMSEKGNQDGVREETSPEQRGQGGGHRLELREEYGRKR